MGAATGGHLDMLSYAVHNGNLVNSMCTHLAFRAKEHGHEHLYEPLILYFGDNIFNNPD